MSEIINNNELAAIINTFTDQFFTVGLNNGVVFEGQFYNSLTLPGGTISKNGFLMKLDSSPVEEDKIVFIPYNAISYIMGEMY